MPKQPLVSIIIPTYNREHLIGETLDSVLSQTYCNWECIIVDDGSTDDTDSVLKDYLSRDSRIKYFHRPKEYLPGGNGARNYGFKKSQGAFIQWFDSDDLMLPNKLQIKVDTIQAYNVDFVISKTKYFNNPNGKDYAYNYTDSEVDFLSYSTTHINWFTPDMMLKRSVVESISFNEELKAGQEFNFSCKLLLQTNHLKKIDEVLTLRRYHKNSILSQRKSDKETYLLTQFQANWVTYNELKLYGGLPIYYCQKTLLKCVKIYLQASLIQLPRELSMEIAQFFGYKVVYFHLALISKKIFGKYYFFYSKIK